MRELLTPKKGGSDACYKLTLQWQQCVLLLAARKRNGKLPAVLSKSDIYCWILSILSLLLEQLHVLLPQQLPQDKAEVANSHQQVANEDLGLQHTTVREVAVAGHLTYHPHLQESKYIGILIPESLHTCLHNLACGMAGCAVHVGAGADAQLQLQVSTTHNPCTGQKACNGCQLGGCKIIQTGQGQAEQPTGR